MVDFHQFSAHSSSTKECEIINVKWLNADLLEIISIVSFDLCNGHFASSFADFYSAEVSSSSNDYCNLVTWQMLSYQYSSNSYFFKMAVYSSSDLSKLFGVPLVSLCKSPFKLNIEIKGS